MSEERARAQQAVKKKREERKISTYYEIKEGKLTRRLRKCPRCGSFMAHHRGVQERWACGNCSFTEFVVAKLR